MAHWLGADPQRAWQLGREALALTRGGQHPVLAREQLLGVPYAQPAEACSSKQSSAGRVIAATWAGSAIFERGWLVCLAVEALGLVRTAFNARPFTERSGKPVFRLVEVPNDDASIVQLIEGAFEYEERRYLKWTPVDVFQSLMDYLSIEYGVTQGWYQHEGVEALALYRGDDVRESDVTKSVTSWSTEEQLVRTIADGARRWRYADFRLYSCNVPVVRCLASWHTTPEIFHRNEHEVVVLHPNGKLDLPCSTESFAGIRA